MKKCPRCKALNSEKAAFCWKCYSPLYTREGEKYLSLHQRIRERVRDIVQYKNIRELLKEKIQLWSEKDQKDYSDEWDF